MNESILFSMQIIQNIYTIIYFIFKFKTSKSRVTAPFISNRVKSEENEGQGQGPDTR